MKYSFFACLHFVLIFLILKSISYIFPSALSSCCVCNAALSLFIWILTFRFTRKRFLADEIEPFNKAVLITGCDTGFGHNLAKRLDSKGYVVFAGCLFPTGPDATTLKESCSSRLRVLGIDVTKDESVQEAVEFVKAHLRSCELWAVVNNAGILKGFSVEITELDEFRENMEVNAFGPVRVTKAFLPLLKKTKGRVVTVTSIVGRIICPYMTPYVMSKFAVVGFSDCLRQELAEYGIRVISIEPEVFRTNISKKELVEEKLNHTFKSAKMSTNEDRERNFQFIKKQLDRFLNFSCPKIELVIDDLEKAISSKYPDSIYRPKRNIFCGIVLLCFEVMPVYFRDLSIKIVIFIFKLF